MGEWYNLVRWCSASFYINGKQVGITQTNAAASYVHNTAIGGSGTVIKNGLIDSTKIYSCLTAPEILANYQAGNIELQTRTSADNSTWEAWKPTTNETSITSLEDFSATGGTITYANGNKIHTFTNGGVFTPSGSGNVEVLVVGGGGGGANEGGGGGGF